MLAALSLAMICAGCSAAPKPAPVLLPQAPDFCAPVTPPTLKIGQDARSALARTYAALGQANGRLRECRGWYDSLRVHFEGNG